MVQDFLARGMRPILASGEVDIANPGIHGGAERINVAIAPSFPGRAFVPGLNDASSRNSSRAGPDTLAPVTRRSPPDVRLPCMLYAAVGAVPFQGGRIPQEDLARARRTPGVVQVLPLEAQGGFAAAVAVIARGRWLSRQVLEALLTQWSGVSASLSGPRAANRAEPETCTAHLLDGRLRLWVPTSDPERVRERAARVSGIEFRRIDVSPVGIGEAHDSMLAPAIRLARELQPAPVQVLSPLPVNGEGSAAATAPEAASASIAASSLEPEEPLSIESTLPPPAALPRCDAPEPQTIHPGVARLLARAAAA